MTVHRTVLVVGVVIERAARRLARHDAVA